MPLYLHPKSQSTLRAIVNGVRNLKFKQNERKYEKDC